MKSAAFRLGDIERHFWLTRSVARTMGVNLSQAMAENRLSADDYALMVGQCRAKDCQDACLRWLAAHMVDGSDGPPDYCAHAEILARLCPRQGEV